MSKIDREVALVESYKAVFSTEHGKAVLNDLMKKSFMLGTTFTVHRDKTVFQEGKRSLMLYILNQLETDPNALRLMMTRADEQELENEKEYL